MSDAGHRNGHGTDPNTTRPATSENPGTSLATLIRDAEALHTTLTEARSNLARLITSLRRHRKQSRLVSETLKSLRQLRLTESNE